LSLLQIGVSKALVLAATKLLICGKHPGNKTVLSSAQWTRKGYNDY